MARSEKNSLVIYYDLEEQTQQLSNEQLGKLLRGMLAYEKRQEYPEFDGDQMLIACFGFVKVTLDINREKYNERCEQNRINGKQGGKGNKRPNINNEAFNNQETSFEDILNQCNSVPIPKTGQGFKPN